MFSIGYRMEIFGLFLLSLRSALSAGGNHLFFCCSPVPTMMQSFPVTASLRIPAKSPGPCPFQISGVSQGAACHSSPPPMRWTAIESCLQRSVPVFPARKLPHSQPFCCRFLSRSCLLPSHFSYCQLTFPRIAGP